MTSKRFIFATVVFSIALFLYLRLSHNENVSTQDSLAREVQSVTISEVPPQVDSSDRVSTPVPETLIDPRPEDSDDRRAKAPVDRLREWLPEWLRKGGMHLQDRREINGHVVLRSRGRYEWQDGEQLEIEITDVGETVDLDLLKALGFDPNLEDLETESGFSSTQDEAGYSVNQEYDFEDQSGSLQILIEGRYLIEIQIQQLPESAFQEVLDTDIPFEAIFKKLQEAPIGQ